ncbi:nSTAND1 domain-containing NTPase [Robiginitalea biformata]|uniref:Peptidase C14, caspase catalytic subunit p20 n=1 Tax=Robiginitalea biformata (strain ATCC BAA-864 / DSM 15991 / KCTC 12146 / HTCC2501) TaxID=313596 RepID=A4CGS1_ROBBH|nr:Peptidase C14, caspase catalytic subunit p20 [Robiginitalea biformata]EAR16129.1 Peptidase C14, caspase catalytic subunit p20 [Robiginitalea biformata HTCC2501]
MLVDVENPYVGLRPYNDDESLLFFGRKEQTMELLQRLHAHHFVAVVGSSGCGKSSLLRAGLIPSLKAGYLVDDSDQWLISIMKPGQNPMGNLAKSLLSELYQAHDADATNQLVQTIEEEGVDAILSLLEPLFRERKTNFFILVDQFEELFRFATEKGNRKRRDNAIDFVNIILELARQKDLPIYVVLTMRSDFIGDCAEFHGLPEAMNQSLYLVPRLNRQQLKMVIEGPARLFGARVNSALSSKLLNEMGRVQDELPLLQHALMRIWEFETREDANGEMDLEDYKAIGGLENALSNHADEALKTLDKNEFQVAKQMFQALTTVDEHGRKTRRPAHYGELLALTGTSEAVLDKVIRVFIEGRRSFLMIDQMSDKKDNIIDISHESLIRQWKRLDRWVEEEGEMASTYMKLSQDYQLYADKKKDLLKGTELSLARDWYERFQPTEAWAKRYNTLFAACREYLGDSEKAEKRDRKNRRNLKIGIWSLAGVMVLAAVYFFVYPIIRDSLDTMRTYNDLKAQAVASFEQLQDQDPQASDDPEQAGISPQEPYLKLLESIEKQGIFYREDAVRAQIEALGEDPGDITAGAEEAAYRPGKDVAGKLKADMSELWVDILAKLKDLEAELDEENWEIADSEGTVEAYTNYLQAVDKYNFPEVAGHLEAAREKQEELSQDPEWTQAQTTNTANAYLEYLRTHIENTEGSTKEDLSPQSQEALERIRAVSRVGWLFAGRALTDEVDDDSLLGQDRVFDLVFRLGEPNVESSRIPKVEDVLLSKSNRAAYNEFTGNSVKGKKGAFIQNGNLVLVLERKILGDVLFLKVAY